MPDKFFLERTESRKILEAMLDEAGRADCLTVCSFAAAEGFMRRLIRLREKYGISKVTVILDFTVASRNRANMLFVARNVDELYLCNTHAKLILIESEKYNAVCAMSANATMNFRYECGIVSSSPALVREAKNRIKIMKNDGKRIEFD